MIRFFDLFFSLIAIIIFSPLILIIMIILRFTGEREIFYLQERIGKDERPFYVYKFATMLKESPNLQGGVITKENDPRVLPFGKILRKIKLNEIPQLFNILFGHMSIIGPRPLTHSQFIQYSDEQKSLIRQLKPGLSGIGSLIFRDEERIMASSGLDYVYIHDVIIGGYKGDLESWFYYNNSIILYFKIIFLTILSVFFPKINYREKFKKFPVPPEELIDLI